MSGTRVGVEEVAWGVFFVLFLFVYYFYLKLTYQDYVNFTKRLIIFKSSLWNIL